ncbi:spore coat protein [Desulfosporosinus sp. HMP52]|uniref:spore coat protein n=1 Tax=Desulfosporosinus sp. HMP52 TaxID=1487923 RepID=UPI001FA7FB00|nr:spore coat protein [Desulfosporosinus sp. HMP52]
MKKLLEGKRISPHETFELHEIVSFKNICATKASAMAGLVTDEELSTLLQQDFTTSQEHIAELKDLIQSSELWDENQLPNNH